MKSFDALLLIVLFLSLPFSTQGAAAPRKFAVTGPVDIQARALEYQSERNTYTAEGDVELREGPRILTADFVLYNTETDDVFAEGNVVFRDQSDVIEADRLTLNLVTKRGTIDRGKVFIKQGNFFITGTEMDKTGESAYSVHEAVFTTCGWDKPAWKFTAREADVTLGGYATTKGTTFLIRDHKVFYLPWSVFPVKTERQSGFLMPVLQLSTRFGFVTDLAYYWAIDKDKDATFDVSYLQKRGVRPSAEVRYYTSETTKGQWYGSIIQDKVEGRWRDQIKGEHAQVFFGDLTFKTKINYVSDYKYLMDYGAIWERSEPVARSTLFVEKPLPYSLLTVENTYYKSMIQNDNDTTFKYLPYVSYFSQFIPLAKGKLFTDVASEAINVYREKGETYRRFNVEPRVRVPYSWNGLNFLLTGAFIERFYGTTFDQDQPQPGMKTSANVQSFRVDGDANVHFMKQTNTSLFSLGDVQSIIVPRVRYTFIPTTSYAHIPNLGTVDQVLQTNSVTYSLGHYFNQLTGTGVREVSLFELEQTYGLTGRLQPSPSYQGFGNHLSDMTARFTFYPSPRTWYTHEDLINFYGKGFETVRNAIGYSQPLARYEVIHAYTKDLANDLWLNTLRTYGKFTGRFQMRYSFLDDRWVDMLTSLTYHPSCWSVTMTLLRSRRPSDTTIKLAFNLTGITSTGSPAR